MKLSRRVLALNLVAALALSVGATSTTAAAEVIPPGPSEPVVIETEMYVTDIDVGQAARAGNKVTTEGSDRVLRDGRTGEELARVPMKGGRTGDVSTAGVVYGTCGSSYIYLRDASGRQFYFYTGFDLNRTAYDFDWYVNVRGERNYAVDNYDWEDHGPISFRSYWTSGNQYTTQDIASGSYYYARVVSGTAYATNGSVCTSGYPSDGRYLYY